MRPILLGECDPHSDDPANALSAAVPGSSGWRLWRMIDEAQPMTREEYDALFERRNLVRGREWDAREARAAADRLTDALPRGSTVVALGQRVWAATCRGYPPEPRACVPIGGSTFTYLPHPSGRNLYYNDAMNRWWAGKLLSELAKVAAWRAEHLDRLKRPDARRARSYCRDGPQ